MSLKRNARIAAVTVVSSLAIGAPAIAAGPAGPAGTIAAGPVKPTVAMSHKEWKKCWSTV